jgi:hypothetical protein
MRYSNTMKVVDGFIENTALDYDMKVEDVKDIYDKCMGDYEKFYEKLEEYIKNRSSKKYNLDKGE